MEPQPWQRGREVIQQSLEFVNAGNPQEALDILDIAISEAIRDGRSSWAGLLCHHAAVVSESMGNRKRQMDYEERALPFAKDFRFAAYNFAQLLLSNGQTVRAEHYAREAYQLSIAATADADRDLVTAILKQWPNAARER